MNLTSVWNIKERRHMMNALHLCAQLREKSSKMGKCKESKAPLMHQRQAAVFLLRKMTPLKYNNYKIAHVLLRRGPPRHLSACE